MPNQFLIDGIDRLGKSTLIENLLNELGYHLVVHYGKPKKLTAYQPKHLHDDSPERKYQEACNKEMFYMINAGIKVIFDRTHLGEMVYAPLYRKYRGDYIYEYEKNADTDHTRLILLTTSDFDICVDDGESFNFDNKVREQQSFLRAFCQSSIQDKVIIDVNDGTGKFKSPERILREALKKVD